MHKHGHSVLFEVIYQTLQQSLAMRQLLNHHYYLDTHLQYRCRALKEHLRGRKFHFAKHTLRMATSQQVSIWLSNFDTSSVVKSTPETVCRDEISQRNTVEEGKFETEAEEDARMEWRPELRKPENINQAKANLKLQDDNEVVRLTRSNSTSTDFFTHVKHLHIGRDFKPLRDFYEAGLTKDLTILDSLLLDIREISEQDKASTLR